MIRWAAVRAFDAAVFAVPMWLAMRFFEATEDFRPAQLVARASRSWRRALVWLFCAPT